MKVTKDFGTVPGPRGDVWFQYTAEVGGEVLSVRSVISYHQYQATPLEYVWQDMRKQIMRKFERMLFEGER